MHTDSQPTRIDVRLPGTRRACGRIRWQPRPRQYRVDKTGRASTAEVLGTVQWLTHLDGPVRALADTAGVRARMPRVAANGDSVWITDAEGDDALAVHHDGETRLVAAGQLGRALELAVAPDSQTAAVASHDGRVLAVMLEDGSVRELERNVDGDAAGLSYSPDSKWLVWSAPTKNPLRNLRMAALETAEVVEVTSERFVDTEPSFTPDGKYLAFLSTRTFDPVYDAHNFELSFPYGARPYLIPLALDTPSPFDPELAGRAAVAAEPEDEAGKADGDKPAGDKAEVPTSASIWSDCPSASWRYRWLRGCTAGCIGQGGLLWLQRPRAARSVPTAPETKPARPSLHRWDFTRRTVVDLVDELDGYEVGGDGTDRGARRREPEGGPVRPQGREARAG